MNPRDETATRESVLPGRVLECITSFASAIKNLSIYPANHPRVVERATDFVARHQELGADSADLIVGQHAFELGGWSIPTEHLAVAWLLQRCRETGIGAIHIEASCQADDLIAFAAALIHCRPRSGTSIAASWQEPTAAIRPIALIVSERHRARRDEDAIHRAIKSRGERAGAASPTTGLWRNANPSQNVPAPADIDGEAMAALAANAGLAEKLRAISNLPSVRELTVAIAEADHSVEGQGQRVDLMSAIAEVLPVDCPTDPQGLQATIECILQGTLEQLQAAARSDSRVRSAQLLRSAVKVAKTYFGRSNAEVPSSPDQPTGRPSDEAIQADCSALLAELAQLPDASNLRLPASDELISGCEQLHAEMLGICLHSMARDQHAAANDNCLSLLAALTKQRTPEREQVLDAYLQPGKHSTPVRLKLLRALHEVGRDDFVRERNYIDDDLLRAGFPEVLPVAARTLCLDSELERVRNAMNDLATVIANGGAAAMASSGLLNDVATVSLLAHCGNPAAIQLLTHCESNDPGVQQALLQCVRGFDLPTCEHLVVHVCLQDETPTYYLRRLLRAAARKQFDTTIRSASGELLREYIRQHQRTMPIAQLGPVIQALQDDPGPETTQLLRELSKLGRLSFHANLRAVRQQAALTLRALQQRKAL